MSQNMSDTHIELYQQCSVLVHVYVVVQFCFWFNLDFPLFDIFIIIY